MKDKITALILTLLLLPGCSADTNDKSLFYENGVSQQLAQHRKENIKNIEYELSFIIPEETDSAVKGNANIRFSIEKPQEIIFDFKELIYIKEVLANGDTVPHRKQNGHIVIPATEFKKGDNSISVSFIAGNQSLNRNRDFLYTLLVPDRARTVFPCFDQPDLKAIFKLTLEVPETWTAVSNSPVNNETRNGVCKVIEFKPTEPLSTYLFSFVAGAFEKEFYNDGKHSFAAFHRETDPKRTAQLPTIFKQVAYSLTWIEEYTGIPYPFAKYDFIILPGFQYGGMEHTGATLYNDNTMFLGEFATPDEELDRAHLIAHETAHMWFGDFTTMKWFDDVWTKEVFANYFASRITEPMFPNINHRLNWLKSIVTPSLAEDRTDGGTAIRQPLDNMENAGLVYNSIIYNKAPVVLEKLIEIMGEEAFKDGIHEYLTKFSYGNASWNDLIGILDRKSECDLAAFSNVWVNSPGMPHIEFCLTDSHIKVRQTDPRKRGLLWPQSFSITLVGNKTEEIEIELNGKETVIPITEKVECILPNSDGRGYGYFRLDNKSKNWTLDNWHNIKDETCRQSQLMNLHEAYQHGELQASEWLHSLVNGLKHEKNELIASTVCSYIDRPLSEVKDTETEKQLLAIADNHGLTSCRLQLLRTLINRAEDSNVSEELYTVWEKKTHPLLNENDYINMAYELAIRFPDRQKQIIKTQRDRISNPDRQKQFDFISRATVPDTLEQEKLFKSLLIAENRCIEPWALKTLACLCHPLRESQCVKYIRPALDALLDIQQTNDIFFPQNWVNTLLRERKTPKALQEVEDFLKDNPNYPSLLKNKILQAEWNLQRVVNNR